MRLRFVLLIVVLLLIVIAILSFARARADPTNGTVPAPSLPSGPTLKLLPDSVNRYDNYAVSVIGPPNATFTVDVYGANGFRLNFANTTGPGAVWSGSFNAYYAYGTYSFQLTMGNETQFADLTVGCDATCQSGILQQNGQDQAAALASYATFYGGLIILLVIALVLPGQVHYWQKASKDATNHGQHTAKGLLVAPFARWRAYIQPGSQVADPANVQNPRIRADLTRRELIDQLHRATDRPFMEWRPKHIETIEEIVHDLRYAYDAQASVQPTGAPYAQTYERPASKVTLLPKPDNIPHEERPRGFGSGVKVAANGGEPGMSDREMDLYAAKLNGERRSGRIVGWALIGAGVLLLLMAALVVAAYYGVHVALLAALWTSWPPDAWKVVLGILGMGVAFAAGLLRLRRTARA